MIHRSNNDARSTVTVLCWYEVRECQGCQGSLGVIKCSDMMGIAVSTCT